MRPKWLRAHPLGFYSRWLSDNSKNECFDEVTKQGNDKKRHHYVPVTYLNRFTDIRGKVFAYLKDEPLGPPLHVKPSEIAFAKYYYSQPTPDGGRDNNRIEDFFSKEVETHWTGLVDDLAARRDILDKADALFNFISLLRVRVPAARDVVELQLAHIVRRQMLRMANARELPPLPANSTFDDIDIAIDPHRSIHAMVKLLQGFARLWEHVGLEVVHNKTTEPFVTSDNPVVYFDPDVPEDKILPYTVRPPKRRVEMLIPVSPFLMLRGRSTLPIIRRGGPLSHVEMASSTDVVRINRFVARFGYRFIFANHDGLGPCVSKCASLSPTVRFDVLPIGGAGEYNVMQMVFGSRPRKPKW